MDDIRLRSNSDFPNTDKTSLGSPRSQNVGSRKTTNQKTITHSYANVNFIKIPETYKILNKALTSTDAEANVSITDFKKARYSKA